MSNYRVQVFDVDSIPASSGPLLFGSSGIARIYDPIPEQKLARAAPIYPNSGSTAPEALVPLRDLFDGVPTPS
jgi:hypothetical protein